MTYLLSESMNTTCTGLAELSGSVSHDSVNRFLLREDFSPRDLLDSVVSLIPENAEGVASIDDSVLDKPYSQTHLSRLVNYYWSGKHKRVVKGINLVTLFFTDLKSGVKLPINFRVVNPEDNKTKNQYFQEMINEILSYGIRPLWVTGDSWYSSLENLKFLRKQKLNALFGVENNRIFSEEKGSYIQAQRVEFVDPDGTVIYLKGFGQVRLFRQNQKNTVRHYIMIQSEIDKLKGLSRADFDRLRSAHWNIEEYHRVLKQECHVEHFQTRSTKAVSNHIFCAIAAYVQLEIKRVTGAIKNWYRLKRDSLAPFIRKIMTEFQVDDFILNLKPSVNA
jgi:hypothetical protein